MNKPVIVIGLGNPLMSDEGIGGFLISKLQYLSDNYADVDFTDAGTGGISLLHLFEHRQKAILIDCAFMNTEPGTFRRFTPEYVTSVKQLANYSLHEADLLRIIAMAKQLGQCPDELVIFGIEPLTIEPGDKLSEPLLARIDDYISAILSELTSSFTDRL